MLALSAAIGLIAGLRSLTAPAAVCWAAHMGSLHLGGSRLSFLGSAAAVWISSALAVVELVLDKQPWIAARTKAGPLIDRLIMGGISGAALSVSASQSLVIGAVGGAAGAVVGTFGGYETRRRIVARFKIPDIRVAVVEDAIAIGGALLIVSRLS